MEDTIRFKGFPEEVSETIELPNIAELLMMPMYNKVSADDLWKHGTSTHREILSKVPLRNNTKYVTINSFVHLLQPSISANVIQHGGKFENEWHFDGSPNESCGSTWHILANDCYARTEFNRNAFDFKDSERLSLHEIMNRLNEQPEVYGIEPVKMPSNKIITFTSNHLHRAVTAPAPEFRFFFRVMETNNERLEPLPYERAFSPSVTCAKDGLTVYKSIEHVGDRIIIYKK